MYFTLIITAVGLTTAYMNNITKEPNRTISNNLGVAGIDYIAIDILDNWD